MLELEEMPMGDGRSMLLLTTRDKVIVASYGPLTTGPDPKLLGWLNQCLDTALAWLDTEAPDGEEQGEV